MQPYAPVFPDPVLEPWRWRQEEMLDGFHALCMDEAPDGTLWFGSIGMVVRYDGLSVKEFPLSDGFRSQLISAQRVPRVWTLQVLPDGDVLVLVGQSLIVLEDGVWRVVLKDAGFTDHCARLKIAKDGSVWLLSTESLWRISRDLRDCVRVFKAEEYHRLWAFCEDGQGDLWLAEQTAWDKVMLVHQPFRDGWVAGECRKVDMPFVYERGNVSLAARQDGKIVCAVGQRITPLLIYSPGTGLWKTVGENELMWSQYSLMEGTDGTVWIGHEGEISRLLPDGRLVEYPDLLFDLPQSSLVLFEGSNQRIWVIGFNGQVCSVDTGFDEWMTYEGLHFEFKTKDGTEWFRDEARHAFVHDTRSGSWKRYGVEDHLPDRVQHLFGSSHGLVWAAGSHEGRAAVSVFDGSQWTLFRFPEFADSIRPNGAFEASDGTVWFGAQGRKLDSRESGGALQFRVNGDRSVELVKHHSPPAFPYYVSAFAEEPDGTLWFGSTLVHRMLKDGRIEAVPELLGDNTDSIFLDRENAVWIAKDNFGVCRWKEGVWRIFTRQDGLADLNLSDLQLLPDGSILAATSRGISRFDGSGWMTSVYPEWFSMSSRWSSLRALSDGDIWLNYATGDRNMSRVMAGRGGACAVRHRPETRSPETVIGEYPDRIPPSGNMYIRWSGQDVYGQTPEEQLTYSWRLNAGDWSPFSRKTEETFFDLKSGRYVLEVRARDRAFNVDPTPARVEFNVLPPVWRQSWFVALNTVLFGLIAGLIGLLIRSRERHLIEKQREHEAYFKSQQAEREQYLLAQQKQLIERQKEREEHLKEMDRIKTGFFTNISHELRTPMTVITGWLETIFASETDDKTKKALSIVLRNAQRVTTLITQLLDFRKIQEGKIRVESTHGDLIPPLRDWVASLQVLAEQARISLSLDVPETVLGTFDFDKLQKIFINLIANAIKYTSSGGEVRIKLEKDLSRDGKPELVFTVEDTGEGIPPEHLDHIFERFYRVSEASIAVGAGIGLNLTKELVELLDGTIQVESPIHADAERPGSRFTVRLPVEQGSGVRGQKTGARDQEFAVSDPSDLPDPSGPADSTDRMNQPGDSAEEAPLILIVEDDEDIRSFIEEGLASVYRVVTAENGDAGLRTAKEKIPDLIVTDLMMPVMDGLTLCRELKAGMETSHIPVILLTAKTALESQIEGLKTGADDYVTKPFHMELLRVRIANLLESRRLLREKFGREALVSAAKVPENTLDKEFVDKALRVLEERYSEWSFKPDDFAVALNMTLRTLQRKIKAVMDRTPADFMNEFRMMKAAELLRETSETVAEIAFGVGYDEPTHFSRQFKKYYQMSPSEYRSANRPS